MTTQKNKRDYNNEVADNERKYSYNFDTDVIHKYLVKSYSHFFKEGNLLDLGIAQGELTNRYKQYFNDITCIEGSSDLAKQAQKLLGDDVNIIISTFEDVQLDQKFNNITMTHVLEHVDDRVGVLKRIKNEWLADDGLFFLACPNGNAPSRQIAVKMGLISHNSAVTEAEKKHGHRITYTLDTLERDATQAGFEVIYRSGIFFKQFANFQWDKIMSTDIITNDFLDASYKLGMNYPDLCSTIFLICRKPEKK